MKTGKRIVFLIGVVDSCDVIYKYLCYKTLQKQERKARGLMCCPKLQYVNIEDISQAMSLRDFGKQKSSRSIDED